LKTQVVDNKPTPQLVPQIMKPEAIERLRRARGVASGSIADARATFAASLCCPERLLSKVEIKLAVVTRREDKVFPAVSAKSIGPFAKTAKSRMRVRFSWVRLGFSWVCDGFPTGFAWV
jgi:hypothetical protein